MNAPLTFSALDRKLGDFLQRLAGGFAPEVRLAAMCASRARAEGNICVALEEIAGMEGAPSLASLRKKLRRSGVVGAPGEFAPLILDSKDRLYLRRYWEYEQELARAIVSEPRLLLLDEPLSNLDAKVREQARRRHELEGRRHRAPILPASASTGAIRLAGAQAHSSSCV